MSKRNTISAFLLPTAAVATLCLFSIVTAQKGSEGTASATKPVKGIDVIVQKNPGNSAARTATTGENGEFTFVDLPPGHYSLRIDPSKHREGGRVTDMGDLNVGTLLVEVSGSIGGPINREWNLMSRKFQTVSNASKGKTAPAYEEKLTFDIGDSQADPNARGVGGFGGLGYLTGRISSK